MAKKPLILAIETSSRIGSVAIAIGEKILAETTFSGSMRHSAEIFPAIQQLLYRFGRKSQEIEHVYISVGPGSFTGLRIATTLAKTMYLANAAKIVAVDTLDVIASNIIDLTGKRGTRDEGSPLPRGQACPCEGRVTRGRAAPLRRRPTPRRATVRERSIGFCGGRTSHKSQIEHRVSSIEYRDKIAPILDAKRNQFFIAVYQHQELTAENAENAEKESKLSSALSANSAIKGWKKILQDSLMSASQFIEKFAGSDIPIWLLGDGLLYYKDKFKAEGIKFLEQKYWSPRAGKVYLLGWQKALAAEFVDPSTLQPNYLRAPDVKEKKIG